MNVHPLCKGTARFIRDLCDSKAAPNDVEQHPDVLAARETLADIMEAPLEEAWGLFGLDVLEIKSRCYAARLRRTKIGPSKIVKLT